MSSVQYEEKPRIVTFGLRATLALCPIAEVYGKPSLVPDESPPPPRTLFED